MAFFSRLTDIVTCNLTSLLAASDDPQQTLDQVIREMEEGLAGARRSVAAAERSLQRVQDDIAQHETELQRLTAAAREALAAGNESAARTSLLLKSEAADVVAGLRQEQQAAEATVAHLTTMLRALEARLSEARRRRNDLDPSAAAVAQSELRGAAEAAAQDVSQIGESRAQAVEAELELLRREMNRAD